MRQIDYNNMLAQNRQDWDMQRMQWDAQQNDAAWDRTVSLWRDVDPEVERWQKKLLKNQANASDNQGSGIGGSLGKALGSGIGGIIGSFGGPVGTMIGSSIGGMAGGMGGGLLDSGGNFSSAFSSGGIASSMGDLLSGIRQYIQKKS